MSGHYYAYQYNDAFKPSQLRNWRSPPNAWPGKLPPNPPDRCRQPLCFIAFDNGHLYPHIKRNACSSPWGDYRTCIWEQKAPCACVGQLRRPQFYFKPKDIIEAGSGSCPPLAECGADKTTCCD